MINLVIVGRIKIMFGKIIGVIDDNIKVINLAKKAEVSLIGIHVIFEFNQSKLRSNFIFSSFYYKQSRKNI